MAKLNLSSPWEVYYKKLATFFTEDPTIHIVYDDIEQEIKIYVENSEKAVALTKLLPCKKEFGNVELKITVVPANINMIKATNNCNVTIDDILDTFNENKAVDDIRIVSGVLSNPLIYIIFTKEVIQYFTDDLGDYHGICSTLYQDLAKELFVEVPGIFYCTNITTSSLRKTWP